MMPMPVTPMIGRVFGRLTVVSEYQGLRADKSKEKRYSCSCACGAEASCLGSNLRRGNVTSCGCYARESTSKRSVTHGLRGAPEYQVWRGLKSRCLNSGGPGYRNYGGRGITVCVSWRNSFEQFFADMGPRPSPEMSLDRIDVEGNYEPGNCRWADVTTQNRNVRVRNPLGVPGLLVMPSGSLRASISVFGKHVHLGTFDNLFDAAAARRSAENRYWTESSTLS